PQIVVANKADLVEPDDERIAALKKAAGDDGYEFYICSAAAHQGLKTVIDKCFELLSDIPVPPPYEPEYVPKAPKIGTVDDLAIESEDGVWNIEGEWIRNLLARINFSDYESRMYFDKILKESGLYDRLEEKGIRDGDTVCIYDLMFDYRQ
ncbi:MAG: Obg family GTPase CgtA, partial [Oscillospiraceae bacterium]|nr:Obg family GTPase CgtA [Oscillospiraceae bacterium]